VSGARLAHRCLLAALTLGLCRGGAQAQEALARTIGGWTVECHRTEAG
jgi:hypothetical protein